MEGEVEKISRKQKKKTRLEKRKLVESIKDIGNLNNKGVSERENRSWKFFF